VRRIGCEFHVDLLPGRRGNVAGVTEVIFHIPVTHCEVRIYITFKFRKDLFVSFSEDIRKHVKTAAMRHANNHFFNIELGRFIDDGL
jgi:hypothetical protein